MDQKGHVDLHEGACYQRQFNGTSGTGATGNDQRAFCSTTYGSGGRVLKTQLLSYQYSSSDGTCQDPRGDENARPVTDAETALNQIRQGSNNFLSGSCNTDLVKSCASSAQSQTALWCEGLHFHFRRNLTCKHFFATLFSAPFRFSAKSGA